ncbi:hypothetical protein LDENG_00093220 [Lucifuga dentata]|nr:hypothetical protein LDENG_00093220 [Lucifuga dentata]
MSLSANTVAERISELSNDIYHCQKGTDFSVKLPFLVKFGETQGNAERIGQFLRELPSFFLELSKLFKRVMCLFEAHMREKLFSAVYFNKSKYRSRLSDAHIKAILSVHCLHP